MTHKEWETKLDEVIDKEEQALNKLFLILAHEYAHPDCGGKEKAFERYDATYAVVEAWHEKMEYYENELKLSSVN